MDQAATFRDSYGLPEQASAPTNDGLAGRHSGALRYIDRQVGVEHDRPNRPETAPHLLVSNIHRVDIIIYPGFQSLDALGAVSVLYHANRQLQRRRNPMRYDVQLVSLAKGTVPSDTGISLESARSLSKKSLPHTAVIVGADDIETALNCCDRIVDWCAWAAPRIHRLAALYSGCFFLAEAGLLDGQKATTHWSIAQSLQEKYPQIDVEEDSIFTRTGNLWTSAGVTSAVDLALTFVEEDCGRQIALDVAREMVVFTKRSGGQSQCSTSLSSQLARGGDMRDLQNWVLEKLDGRISVDEMARHTGMSIRHFARTFREKTGLTPSQFVEHARLEKALGLLEDSNLPLKTIAFRCGFASDEQMRKVFKKRFSTTAGEYRRKRLNMARLRSLETGTHIIRRSQLLECASCNLLNS